VVAHAADRVSQRLAQARMAPALDAVEELPARRPRGHPVKLLPNQVRQRPSLTRRTRLPGPVSLVAEVAHLKVLTMHDA
jgi:hypothetical protein